MGEKAFVEVIGGRFYCENCNHSWIGTWHGPKEEMICPWCEKKMIGNVRKTH